MNDIDYTLNYKKWHDDSPAHTQAMQRYFQKSLQDFLPRDRSQAILEVGCGSGFALGALQAQGYNNILGIDIDAGQVAAAVARNLPAVHVPASAWPDFAAEHLEKFSLVFAFDVLEHVPMNAQIEFLRSIKTMLQSAGTFVCQVPNAVAPVANYSRYNDWTHHTAFTVDSLEFVMRSAGLSPIGVRPSIDPSPIRTGLKALLVDGSKLLLRAVVRGAWRLVLASEVGVHVSIRHPVSPNLVMVARRTSKSGQAPQSAT